MGCQQQPATLGRGPLQVDLCGRPMNIGRPKGYIPPPEGAAAPAGGGLAQSLLQSLQPQATTVLLLTNPLPAGQLRTSSDCRIVSALCV